MTKKVVLKHTKNPMYLRRSKYCMVYDQNYFVNSCVAMSTAIWQTQDMANMNAAFCGLWSKKVHYLFSTKISSILSASQIFFADISPPAQ